MSDETTVERISHTAASPEGANSTYVLPACGLVVDPGPPGDESWGVLRDGLSAIGLDVESVETVVVTHWHADHAGLAPRLAAAAGAELAMHEADAPLVADYGAERARRVERDARRLREWGVPDEIVDAVRAGDSPSPMPAECQVTGLVDGDLLGDIEVVHAPGHTAGHLVLDAGDALFLGDAVLPMYTPNVGGTDTRMDDSLATYLDTLDRVVERVNSHSATPNAFPGHGSTVDLSDRIAVIRAHHAERVLNARAELPAPGSDGRTPWSVARSLFGEMRGIHAKMGAGEAAAHLEYAVRRGLAERVDGDIDRYVRTDGTVPDSDAVLLDTDSPSRYR
ncbi:MBL fold metallo-hydrolase [Haloferax namakaokahaiae]|uniref:MBL fold metallo-hydrolase n=1 Tax=Haloferax namakaokahaiae TaxID=1748331 RepID=A0ABD5ZDL2_9EURY